MKTAKLFRNGQSQAVRLPKEFRMPGKEVYVKRVGEGVMLLPMSGGWEALFDSIDMFTPDFMEDRDQPEQQQREELFE